MSTQLKSIEQKRADIAWKYAQNKKTDKKYETNIPKAPSYIKTNGLLYAVAFMYSKKGTPQKPGEWFSVYNDLEDYFKTKDPQELIRNRFNGNKELMQVLVEIEDATTLQLVTAEAMALLTWLKRFVTTEEDTSSDNQNP